MTIIIITTTTTAVGEGWDLASQSPTRVGQLWRGRPDTQADGGVSIEQTITCKHTYKNIAITCASAVTPGERGSRLGGCKYEIGFPGNSLHSLLADNSCLLKQGLEFGWEGLRMRYLRTRKQPGHAVCQAGVTEQAGHKQMSQVGTTAVYPGLA